MENKFPREKISGSKLRRSASLVWLLVTISACDLLHQAYSEKGLLKTGKIFPTRPVAWEVQPVAGEVHHCIRYSRVALWAWGLQHDLCVPLWSVMIRSFTLRYILLTLSITPMASEALRPLRPHGPWGASLAESNVLLSILKICLARARGCIQSQQCQPSVSLTQGDLAYFYFDVSICHSELLNNLLQCMPNDISSGQDISASPPHFQVSKDSNLAMWLLQAFHLTSRDGIDLLASNWRMDAHWVTITFIRKLPCMWCWDWEEGCLRYASTSPTERSAMRDLQAKGQTIPFFASTSLFNPTPERSVIQTNSGLSIAKPQEWTAIFPIATESGSALYPILRQCFWHELCRRKYTLSWQRAQHSSRFQDVRMSEWLNSHSHRLDHCIAGLRGCHLIIDGEMSVLVEKCNIYTGYV